jgi:hypothetical protein
VSVLFNLAPALAGFGVVIGCHNLTGEPGQL